MGPTVPADDQFDGSSGDAVQQLGRKALPSGRLVDVHTVDVWGSSAMVHGWLQW